MSVPMRELDGNFDADSCTGCRFVLSPILNTAYVVEKPQKEKKEATLSCRMFLSTGRDWGFLASVDCPLEAPGEFELDRVPES